MRIEYVICSNSVKRRRLYPREYIQALRGEKIFHGENAPVGLFEFVEGGRRLDVLLEFAGVKVQRITGLQPRHILKPTFEECVPALQGFTNPKHRWEPGSIFHTLVFQAPWLIFHEDGSTDGVPPDVESIEACALNALRGA